MVYLSARKTHAFLASAFVWKTVDDLARVCQLQGNRLLPSTHDKLVNSPMHLQHTLSMALCLLKQVASLPSPGSSGSACWANRRALASITFSASNRDSGSFCTATNANAPKQCGEQSKLLQSPSVLPQISCDLPPSAPNSLPIYPKGSVLQLIL